MRQFFISVLGSIVGFFIALVLVLVALAIIGSSIASSFSKDASKSMANNSVLSLDLRHGLIDHSKGESLFDNSPDSVVEIVRALDRAKTDDSIKGLLIRANGYGMAPAQAEEINIAIKNFKSDGKYVIAHAQGFEGTTLSGYMAVSAADEIWLQDTTSFALSGYRAEVEFLGGVFEKFDAKPEFVQFYEYKNMANTYTQKTMTDAHRESMTSLIESIFTSASKRIVENRKITSSKFETLLGTAPHSAETAKELGMIDKLGHWVDAREYAKEKAGKNAKLISITDYGVGYNSGPVIAFIGGQGPVTMGTSGSDNPFSNAISMGGDTVSEAFIKAAKNKSVKAIVFRLNTPGGSATASDQIWDAVERAKDAGKPVIVSMGQYAASGGYYVAANADKIVALPTTITGSIGVVGGKIVIDKTLDKVGYNVESITAGGEFTAAYSAFEPWNQATREGVRSAMEEIYIDFTTKVAEGRNIPIATVREIAKGRVWTGEQALELGLVDHIGGFNKALEIAKELADIDEDKKVRVRPFPRPKTSEEQILEMFNVSAQLSADMEDLRVITQSPEYQAFLKTRTAINENGAAQMKSDLIEIK